MNKVNKAWTISKVNFRYGSWIAYLVTIICVLGSLSNYITALCFDQDNTIVSSGNYLYMICLMAPIFLASINYNKAMHIGVKKKTYLRGCILNYIVFAAVVSVVSTCFYYFIDLAIVDGKVEYYNLIEVFGWDDNAFTAIFCQFAFLLLVEAFVHTLTFIQTKWYGFVTDIVIIAIISVFTPIAVLRQAEQFFFYLIIFIKPAIAQIGICVGLSAVFLWSNRYFMKRRND